VPEDGITAPQRDQIILVQSSREARRELPENRLFAHSREDDRLRVVDGISRDVDLDAPGPVAGGGYGEEYLGPGDAPLSIQQVRQSVGSGRCARYGDGRVLARGRFGFVEDAV
jgi:hypothetical protein